MTSSVPFRVRRPVRVVGTLGVLLTLAAVSLGGARASEHISSRRVVAASVGPVRPLPVPGDAGLPSPEPAAAPSAAPAPAPTPTAPAVIARVGAVTLRDPSEETIAVGFHEGADDSLALEPNGEAVANPRGVDLPPPSEDGADYAVMPSRGRPAPATSAVDVSVPVGTPIQSVVTGTVEQVSTYALYGRTTDVLIEIRPDADPDAVVRMFHVVDPTVDPGDRVEAGITTVAGGSRPLPFPSQIDRYSGAPTPHVHVQVDRG